MNFDELTSFLEKRVQLPMPGAAAHRLMTPKLADGAPVKMKHSTPPRKGGVLILLYQDGPDVYFPLIQRPQYEGIHSGQMALPGGRYEEGDEDQFFTAMRETEEEIGVPVDQIEIIGSLSEFFVAASNYLVLPAIGITRSMPTFTPEPREVDEVVPARVVDLIHPDTLKEKEIVVRNNYRLTCPYFDLENRTVWGATAMMLSELVAILREFNQG